MNRQLSQQDSSASLDLMLDVLSNVFGGIILICCLLAILPRQSTPPPLSPVELARSEMMERRVAAAKTELEALRKEIVKLTDTADPAVATLFQKRDELVNTLQVLQQDIKMLEGDEDFAAEVGAIMALGKSQDLEKQLQEIKRRLVSEENINKAMLDKVAHIEKRQKALDKQRKEIVSGRQYSVRFPKEKLDDSDPFPIIIRYGRVYPLVVGKGFKENPAIRSVPIDDDATAVKPIPGMGWVLPKDVVKLKEALEAARGKRLYISVYLYPDSHAVFNHIKPHFFAAKVDYGMEFVPTSRNLTFSSEGSKPPKL